MDHFHHLGGTDFENHIISYLHDVHKSTTKIKKKEKIIPWIITFTTYSFQI
jgi:molecular chaperone DnaK (HSP70)